MIDLLRFVFHYCSFRMWRARKRYPSDYRWWWLHQYILLRNRAFLERLQRARQNA